MFSASMKCMERADTLIIILCPLEILGNFTVSRFLDYRNLRQKISAILNYEICGSVTATPKYYHNQSSGVNFLIPGDSSDKGFSRKFGEYREEEGQVT